MMRFRQHLRKQKLRHMLSIAENMLYEFCKKWQKSEIFIMAPSKWWTMKHRNFQKSDVVLVEVCNVQRNHWTEVEG